MKTCAARLQAIRVQDWTQDSGIRGMFLGLFFGFRPGFPFSKWTTNLIKCTKSPYGSGLRCDQGGVEADWRWVRRKISPFSSLSIAR
jgi:hypothetical protein